MKACKSSIARVVAVAMLSAHGYSAIAIAADEDPITAVETETEKDAASPDFTKSVQDQYKLTDAQMKTMTDAGFKANQMAITAALAEKSGKLASNPDTAISDIVKMRTEQKMGWGKIAKELGVPPREIGQSVASLHRNAKSDPSAKAERKEMRAEKKAERKARKEEKKEARDNRRAEKAERKNQDRQ